MFILKTKPRSTSLKAKDLRRNGLIPVNLYGGDDSIHLQITQNEVKELLKEKTKGGKVQLDVEGKKIDSILREIGRSFTNGPIEHISFQRLIEEDTVRSSAQIVLKNKEKIPVYIQQTLYEIPYRAKASQLIEKIEIDLDGMHAGDTKRVMDIPILNENNIELLIKPESLIVSIIGNKKAASVI
jgi:ribosomal protein L25, Ctc-form